MSGGWDVSQPDAWVVQRVEIALNLQPDDKSTKTVLGAIAKRVWCSALRNHLVDHSRGLGSTEPARNASCTRRSDLGSTALFTIPLCIAHKPIASRECVPIFS
jgi:hypothetical protein